MDSPSRLFKHLELKIVENYDLYVKNYIQKPVFIEIT